MKKITLIILVTIFTQALFAQPTIGLKNFRSIYYSLSTVLEVKPTQEIKDYYKTVWMRFPKDGRANEMSSTLLLSAKGLAGMFCREFAKTYQPSSNVNEVLSDLSERIYGRALSIQEAEKLTELLNKTSSQDKTFLTCTAMTSSIEFLVQ